MNKTNERLLTIICSNCQNSFPIKAVIQIGTEGLKEMEIDITCPHCDEFLTSKIRGNLELNQISLRHFKGKSKNLNK